MVTVNLGKSRTSTYSSDIVELTLYGFALGSRVIPDSLNAILDKKDVIDRKFSLTVVLETHSHTSSSFQNSGRNIVFFWWLKGRMLEDLSIDGSEVLWWPVFTNLKVCWLWMTQWIYFMGRICRIVLSGISVLVTILIYVSRVAIFFFSYVSLKCSFPFEL